MSNTKAQGTPITKVIAKAWSDPAFKKRLLDDPAAILSAEGVVIPQGVAVKVVENTAKLVHLVLPLEGALPDAALENAVGGMGMPGSGCTIDFQL